MNNKILVVMTVSLLLVFQTGCGVFGNGAKQVNGKDVKKGALDIVFVKDNYDFGVVEQGNYPGYEFIFVNKSEVPVQVQEFRGCNLTVPAYSKETINPQDSGFFKLILNPRDISGKFQKKMQLVFKYEKKGEDQYTYEEVYLTGKVIRGYSSKRE
ncbi:MAG: DUF1573 domain-containing protein [Bacteroidia bacterium]